MRYYDSLPSRLTDFVNTNQLLSYRMLCNSNPHEVRKNCFLYFTSLGLDNFVDMENFHYLMTDPMLASDESDDTLGLTNQDKKTRLTELETRLAEFKKTFRGI